MRLGLEGLAFEARQRAGLLRSGSWAGLRHPVGMDAHAHKDFTQIFVASYLIR